MPIHSDRILYEDDHLLAVNKLSGELVVKGAGRVDKLPLFDFLKKDYPGLRVLHRIDFETSGVVVFAKSKKVYDAIRDSNFAGWRKVYRALVMGRIERDRGVIRSKLPARSRGDRGSGIRDQDVEAITRYRVLDRFANSSYVEVEIETGRHHQIRRHFASIDHPLVLDHVYGHKKFNNVFRSEFGYRRFFLHAAKVEMKHPMTGKFLFIEAKMPTVFEEVLKRLR